MLINMKGEDVAGHTMGAYTVAVNLHSILTSAVHTNQWSPSYTGHFIPRKVHPVPTEQEAGRGPQPMKIF
jgi:hypothetical protein